MVTITGFTSRDVRFPVSLLLIHAQDIIRSLTSVAVQTSLDDTGSDAMNGAVDFSTAYCILKTDSEFTGHGMVSILWF